GHFPGHRTARRGQGHVDGKVAVVVEIDLVDEAELVDIDWNFRIIDGLERADQFTGDALDFRFGQRGRHGRGDAGVGRCFFGHDCRPQAKNFWARSMPSTSASTSSLPLYRASEARQVEVTPKRLSRGWAQWVPARTAMP